MDKVEKADYDFGQDLWLIAETALLKRLTISSGKSSHLSAVFHAIREIMSLSQNPIVNRVGDGEEISLSDGALDPSSLAGGFSRAVELLEGMNYGELYQLINWLRSESPDNDLPVESMQIENYERLEDTIANANDFVTLSRSQFHSMQSALYEKSGDGAPAILYGMGEGLGKKIALTFKAKGLQLGATIREIERAASLAGWGDYHFHRVGDEVECVIENTIFSYEREGMECSCHFAAGLGGGIFSSIFEKMGRFAGEEIRCVSGGFDSCMFKIKKSDETSQAW